MFSIAELPGPLRENYLVPIGLWYDRKKKPLMNTFLHPFCVQLYKCYYDGIKWINPKNDDVCSSKIVAPLIIADAPARAEIQNILNFNGKYGCNICQIKTRKCRRVEGKRTTRSYIFNEKRCMLRSDERMQRQAEKASENRSTCKGVKGRSIVSALPLLDLSTCFIPEFMHSVCLGVGTQFLEIFLKNKGAWSLKDSIDDIDNFLHNIRPPNSFNRMPRGLSLYTYFKASEILNWILYYSLPTLVKYLPDLYFQHWQLFVSALFILLQNKINPQELEQADICLRLFVRQIKTLYSDREYTYNIHQLLHLTLCVKRWGPLGAVSAFPFQNYNGFLSRIIHGTNHLGQEIINNLTIAQGVKVLKNKCQNVKDSQRNNSDNSDNNSYKLLGRKTKNFPCTEEERKLLSSKNICIDQINIHSLAVIRGDEYSSQLYKITKSDNSNVQVLYDDNSAVYGSIRLFFEKENNLYILLQRFTVVRTNIFVHRETNVQVKHIVPFEVDNKYLLLQLNLITSLRTLIRVGDYVCKCPNTAKKGLVIHKIKP